MPKNSVLLCCTASIGAVAYTNIDITTNQQFNGITVKDEYKNILDSNYLLIYALTLKKLLKQKLATATTFGFISVAKVESLLLPLPPMSGQKLIVSKYNELNNSINTVKNSIVSIEKNKEKFISKILDTIFSDNSSYKSYYENEFALGDILPYEQPAPYIVASTEYSDAYETPVLTPGKTFILGYTNEKKGIYKIDNKKKVIIFDDFTTASRLVDFDFKVKSSAMKILSSTDNSKFDIEYMYYLLQTIKINANTHKRFWISEYAPIKLRIHAYNEQLKIVDFINKSSKLLN